MFVVANMLSIVLMIANNMIKDIINTDVLMMLNQIKKKNNLQ